MTTRSILTCRWPSLQLINSVGRAATSNVQAPRHYEDGRGHESHRARNQTLTLADAHITCTQSVQGKQHGALRAFVYTIWVVNERLTHTRLNLADEAQ